MCLQFLNPTPKIDYQMMRGWYRTGVDIRLKLICGFPITPNDHLRGAPAKPPAQPIGMAESDMNKSSWQKPASPHTVAATKSIGALIGGELMPPDWRSS